MANSAPDGYMLMLTSNGHTILGALNKDLTIDPIKDFSSVTQIASIPVVLIVSPTLPISSLNEPITLAKTSRERSISLRSSWLVQTTLPVNFSNRLRR